MFKKALRIGNPEASHFADVHRFPQHPLVKNGKNITRPIINKLTNSFDKHQIFKTLKNPKAYNERLNLKPKQPGYAYITEHLLRDLQLQNKQSLSHYQEAKKEKVTWKIDKNLTWQKKTWKINDRQYQLHVDNLRVRLD